MKGIHVKYLIKTILCTALAIFILGCQDNKQQTDTPAPNSDKEKISYAIGASMGQSISDISDEIDLPMLQKGMKDRIDGKEMVLCFLYCTLQSLKIHVRDEYKFIEQNHISQVRYFPSPVVFI